jgi:hypothetical protein
MQSAKALQGACVGAFVAAALFYIRLLTAKDNE